MTIHKMTDEEWAEYQERYARELREHLIEMHRHTEEEADEVVRNLWTEPN